jgi:hypothetical protein
MRNILIATTGLMMLSGAAMAQTSTQTPSNSAPEGYVKNGPMVSSNGAAVAPNGGLKSGVGTTLANPASPASNQRATGALGGNSGGSNK